MPDKNVQLPDGRIVAFPDSMADADIANVIKQQLAPKPAMSAAQETVPSTVPGAQTAHDIYQKVKDLQNLTQEYKADHPIQAKVGDLLNSVQGFLTGNPQHPESAIGTGQTGMLTNPVTAGLIPGTGGTPAAAELAAGGVNLAKQGTQAVKEGVQAASDLLPSAEHAGSTLGQIKSAVGDIPIDMTRPGNTALELYEQSQRGATLPKVVRDFVKRATTPGSEPITYAEAKDFQSNVSALSAEERMALKPNTKRLLGQLNQDLKGSLEDAADTQGKGEQFVQAMKEYHNAMTLRGMTDAAKANAWKVALGALGVGGAKKVWDWLTPTP